MTTGGRIGGAERLIADVARAAKRTGSDVEVCVLGHREDLGVELAADGIIVHELGLARAVGAPAVLFALARLVRRRRYDVVHTHLIHASAIGLAAARLGGIPLAVMTRHYERYAWLYGTRLDRTLQRAANAMAHHIFAISDAARETMVRLEGVTPDRISVVPNGIDLERVRRRAVASAQVFPIRADGPAPRDPPSTKSKSGA